MAMTPSQARAALARREPRLPLAQAQEWASRYADDADDDRVIDAVAPAVRARGHFLRDEFLDTYRWKTHRTLRHAEKYSEAEIADVTGVAFRQTDEKLRISLLRALDGVNFEFWWPTWSAAACLPQAPA